MPSRERSEGITVGQERYVKKAEERELQEKKSETGRQLDNRETG